MGSVRKDKKKFIFQCDNKMRLMFTFSLLIHWMMRICEMPIQNERTDGPKELNKTKKTHTNIGFWNSLLISIRFLTLHWLFCFHFMIRINAQNMRKFNKSKNSFETAVWPQITPSSLSTRVNNNSCKQILCWKLKTCEKRVQYRTLAIITHNRTAYRITAKMRIN